MKYSAQVIYTDFIELFDINIDDNNLDIKLSNISGSKHQLNTDLILDLSSNVKESYSVFPYEIGDLAIIQIGNTFVLVNHTSTGDNWYKFNSDQITKYLFDSKDL